MAVRLADETRRTQRRCRLRVPGRARGVRAAGAVAAHRCARRQGQGRGAARPLPGDAGPRERADAVVPAQWRGAVRSRRHHRAASRRARRAAARDGATSLPDRRKAELEREARRLAEGGIPADLAADIAALDVLGLAPPITEIAEETRTAVPRGGARLSRHRRALAHRRPRRQGRRHRHAGLLRPPGGRPGARPARGRAGGLHARRRCARDADGVEAWLAGQGDRLGRVRSDARGDRRRARRCTVSRLLVAAGQLSDLAARLGRSFSISQEGPSSGSLPDPPPAEARPLVSPHGGLVPDRHEAAARHGERGGEHLLGEQRERGAAEPAAAMLGRRR